MARAALDQRPQPRCTEINSIGRRCSHLATHGPKCGYHDPYRKRCIALRDDGERCERMPMVGEETCGVHVGAKKRVCNDAIGRPTGGFSPEDTEPQEPEASELEETDFLLNITDGRQFANAVLNSRDFRQYIVYGLRRRDIPPTLLIRLMDYAEGWGKPPERVEIDAKVEAVTEVRRVVIRVDAEPVVVSEPLPPALTH